MNYAQNIKSLREDNDLYQKDIAKILGTTQSYYAQIVSCTPLFSGGGLSRIHYPTFFVCENYLIDKETTQDSALYVSARK